VLAKGTVADGSAAEAVDETAGTEDEAAGTEDEAAGTEGEAGDETDGTLLTADAEEAGADDTHAAKYRVQRQKAKESMVGTKREGLKYFVDEHSRFMSGMEAV
jgi:hypothetical protein